MTTHNLIITRLADHNAKSGRPAIILDASPLQGYKFIIVNSVGGERDLTGRLTPKEASAWLDGWILAKNI